MIQTKVTYPKYPAYKDSGAEWLGEIPDEWELKRVKTIFRLVVQPAIKNNDFELLSVYTDIGVKPRKELEERGNKASTTDGYWLVKKGDIIVNKLLAWMGAIGISKYNGVTSPAYDILRSKLPIEGDFYHYLFRTTNCISELKKHSRGIMEMRLRLYFDKFGDIRIPYPPKYQQTAIANFLDEKTAKIDNAIARKERLIALLKERKQIVIQNAVTKGLNLNAPMKDSGVAWIGQIPAHWTVKRLKYVTKINSFSLPENTTPFFQFEYVDIGSVSFEKGIEKTETYFFNKAPSRARRLAKLGNTIISTVRTYLKAIDFITEDKVRYVYSTGFAILQSNESIDNKFLFHFIRSNAFTDQVKINSKGMSYPAINSSDLGDIFTVFPDLFEQQKIVQHIESQYAKTDRAIRLQEQQIETLKTYKAVLINSAVTGKLKVC
ncbi:MAG: restriction endonuclease subunit S [Bacteroidales bacterium]|nr:restriction endonuclease subunit S [Bacteroidales bacterium]